MSLLIFSICIKWSDTFPWSVFNKNSGLKSIIHLITICLSLLDITDVPVKFWCQKRKCLTPQKISIYCMTSIVQVLEFFGSIVSEFQIAIRSIVYFEFVLYNLIISHLFIIINFICYLTMIKCQQLWFWEDWLSA